MVFLDVDACAGRSNIAAPMNIPEAVRCFSGNQSLHALDRTWELKTYGKISYALTWEQPE
jgi:hypothetical protein